MSTLKFIIPCFLLLSLLSLNYSATIPKTGAPVKVASFPNALHRKKSPGGGGSRLPKPIKKPKPGKFGDDGEEEEENENDTFDPPCRDINNDGEIDPLTECDISNNNNNDDDDLCFPADAVVTVRNKGYIPISQLNLGDSVLLADGSFSPVYHFSHHIQKGTFPFLTFFTKNGKLSASAGHFVYSEGSPVQADSLKVGDSLEIGNGGKVRIEKIVKEWKTGLYNPHTMGGELVVNGFRVSEFTKAASVGTATGALAPLRALYRFAGVGTVLGENAVNALHMIIRTVGRISV